MTDIIKQLNDELDTPTKKVDNRRKNKVDSIKPLSKISFNYPNIIKECLDNQIDVKVSIRGYYIGGFYGLNKGTPNEGYLFLQETIDPGKTIGIDHKNGQHLIESLKDLATLNGFVWAHFLKQDAEHNRPDDKWFSFLLKFGAVSISPTK